MNQIDKLFGRLRRTILMVLLAGLISFVSLPTLSVQAANQKASDSAANLTEKVKDLVHEKDSQRPKTTGEFQQEARKEVPLNERLGNITRDSAEALKDTGTEYSKAAGNAASNAASNLKDTTVGAGKDLSSPVQR